MKPELIRRLVAEFAIIFVGVVLAFQFENWREVRNDREREAETLQALAEDFATNRSRLAETVASQRRTVESLDLWLLASAGRPLGVSLDSLGRVFSFAISWYGEEIVSGAFDALTGSGDMGILRQRELRRRLAEFYGVVDAGFEDHDDEMNQLARLVELSAPQLGPLVAPGGVFTRASAMTHTDPVWAQELMEIPGMWGLLGWKAILARNRLTHLQWLAAQADTIAGLLPPPSEPRRP